MSYYEVLGIPFDADEDAIRTAFRRLARQYHPDAGEGASPESFRELVEAYQTLSDPGRRRAYDLSLRPVRQRVIPVEPIAAGSRKFFRAAQAPPRMVFGATNHPAWDDLFEELLRSLDDFFAPPSWW